MYTYTTWWFLGNPYYADWYVIVMVEVYHGNSSLQKSAYYEDFLVLPVLLHLS